MKLVSLKVKGMSCQHCVRTIEGSVSKLTGIELVKVNLFAANVELTYDPSKLNLEEIKEAIESLGYEVLS